MLSKQINCHKATSQMQGKGCITASTRLIHLQNASKYLHFNPFPCIYVSLHKVAEVSNTRTTGFDHLQNKWVDAQSSSQAELPVALSLWPWSSYTFPW
jgi:hypothetical protein